MNIKQNRFLTCTPFSIMKKLLRHSSLFLFSVVLAISACGGGGGGGSSASAPAPTPAPTPGATLTSIAVTPATQSIVQGATQQFTATGTYSDGSTQNITASVSWSAATTSVATINTAGIATAVAPGSSVISATSGAVSGSTSLNVTLASIGGTVSGLAVGNSIVLQNNNADNITVTVNGAFTFATKLGNGAAYNATILTLPINQPCSSTYASGTVNAANITKINIFCGPAPVGLFSAAASMVSLRHDHTATLLPSGKVLVVGGSSGSASQLLSSAELYDPASNTWTAAGSMINARDFHSATLLPNGKVLVVGGMGATVSVSSSAELYDPATNTWSAASSPTYPHTQHTATLLSNGKVLVICGYSYSPGAPLSPNVELYDPTTNTWSAASSPTYPRTVHTATLLSNGKVLIAGGLAYGINGFFQPSTAEQYDPATNSWSAGGFLNITRDQHAATLLPNGKVLVTGGRNISPTNVLSFINSAELYDPATNSWTVTAAMPITGGVYYHTATLLPTGKVLAAGGGPSGSSVLYDPAVNAWVAMGLMITNRYAHTASLLPNGKLLLVGGVPTGTGGNALSSAELYW